MSKKFISPSKFVDKLSDLRPSKSSVLIYDKILASNEAVHEFSKLFSVSIAVESGESLKNFESLERITTQIIYKLKEQSMSQPTIWALGGGSLGDFCGFLASILFRGVALVHVPSTWLSAIDSAHGGKTALNVGEFKNQVGTFYFAETVYLVRDLLQTQGDSLLRQAMSEAWKMAVIDGSPWAKKFLFSKPSDKSTRNEILWKNLKNLIDAKNKLVSRDPLEKKGLRRKLNLGHTLAHAMELRLGLSHGEAVAWGLAFALHISSIKKILKSETYKILYKSLHDHVLESFSEKNPWGKIPQSELRGLILSDKKSLPSSKIEFVVIKDLGKVELLPISVDDLVKPLYSHEKH